MKNVLVCPLDWGLGHATRCIPVILELQNLGACVLIASSGAALELLRLEFPTMKFFELPAYRPLYSASIPMAFKLALQLPKFRKTIEEERRRVEEIVTEFEIDSIISDNRYGCWSMKAKSVLITHQPSVLMPAGMAWAGGLVNAFVRRRIAKFDSVWIPDQEGSGLTVPFVKGKTFRGKYIGWLSRFSQKQTDIKLYDIIALISGPEPHRTIFEKLITDQLIKSDIKSLVIAGLPGNPFRKRIGNVEIVNHLAAADLELAIRSANLVISRSGYSTIMDLVALGKKAIFVPTPQQPEQLYLARFCDKERIALAASQSEFSLLPALEKAENYSGFSRFTIDKTKLTKALTALIA